MLKQQARTIAALLYAADLSVTLATLPVAYTLRSELLPRLFSRLTPLYEFNLYLVLVAPTVLLFSGLLFLEGAYRSHRTLRLKDEVALMTRASFLGSLLLALVVFGARWDFISRPFLAIFFVVNILFLVAERVTVRLVARRVRSLGFNFRTVVLVGDTRRADGPAHPRAPLVGSEAPRPRARETRRGRPDDDRERSASSRLAAGLPEDPHGIHGRRGRPRRGPRRPAEARRHLPALRGDGREDAARAGLLPARPRARRARGARGDAAPHVLDHAGRRHLAPRETRRRHFPLGPHRRRVPRARHASRPRRQAPHDDRRGRGAHAGRSTPQRARRPGLQGRE